MRYVIKERSTGTIIAEGDKAVHMIEGGWYFPAENVNLQHLHLTDRTYTCPYKGVCHWIDLDTPNTRAQNIAWIYDNPKPGYEEIKGYIGFWNRDTQGTLALEEM